MPFIYPRSEVMTSSEELPLTRDMVISVEVDVDDAVRY